MADPSKLMNDIISDAITGKKENDAVKIQSELLQNLISTTSSRVIEKIEVLEDKEPEDFITPQSVLIDENAPPVVQNLEELDISSEFAGMLLLIVQLQKAKYVDQDRALDLILQFYEYDTGKLLKPEQFVALMRHNKVLTYDEKCRVNVERSHARRVEYDLAKIEKDLLGTVKFQPSPEHSPVETDEEIKKDLSNLEIR